MPQYPDPDHVLKLIVDGREFAGWLDIRVGRGIERAAGDFRIGATNRWPGSDAVFLIPEGAPCEISIGKDKVLTGYVDAVEQARDAGSAGITVSGRSRTADLIDCSPDYDTVELAGLDIAQVARRVAAPFKVEVVAQDTGPAFAVAAAHHGESAWKLVERLARQRQLLVMDDEEGRLVLARLASVRAHDKLVHPADGLKQIATKRDMSGRFSVYKVKAQAGERWAEEGSDLGTVAESLAHVEGSVRDPGVTRYRPKTIQNEGAAKKAGAQARAEWEARRNIGKSLGVTAIRAGWRQSNGALWKPNQLVAVEIPAMNLEADLALAHVSYIKGPQGEVVELSLAPPEAFTPEPPESAVADGSGGGQGIRWGETIDITTPEAGT
ncbi:MAG: hypothetical protein KIS73_28020 [Enhydrobacter sp.]|nr:hypothetical protein [Enhydrobacter sp.]